MADLSVINAQTSSATIQERDALLSLANSSLPDKSILGVNDFLKLITEQLKNQDPMEPMKDLDFIAQMSSFTAQQQMTALNENFKFFSSQNALGKEVVINEGAEDITGTVTAVTQMPDKSIRATVNGRLYNMTDIREMKLPQSAPSA